MNSVVPTEAEICGAKDAKGNIMGGVGAVKKTLAHLGDVLFPSLAGGLVDYVIYYAVLCFCILPPFCVQLVAFIDC